MWIMNFYSFELNFDQMTSIFKIDLDIVKSYLCTEIENEIEKVWSEYLHQ